MNTVFFDFFFSGGPLGGKAWPDGIAGVGGIDFLSLRNRKIHAWPAIKPGLHEQIKHALFPQIFDPYEVTLLEYAQLKRVLFAHENAALH